ncbi:MAG: hypothetical protein MJZ64_05225 [Paludibacteraceae bacterium]|nr:hypothetical protein [Paludibacteraceae bacterium]
MLKPIWKHIIASVCAVIVVAYMVFGITMSHRTALLPCRQVLICIQDSAERMYITKAEIMHLLNEKKMSPIGLTIQDFHPQRIEDAVTAHPMLRTCECYTDIRGNICLRVTQRIPLVRVVTGADTYFIDTDRKLMPVRASVKTSVLAVTGDVSRRMAAEQISDFAEWLQYDEYWKNRIIRIQMDSPQMVRLIQSDGAADICLGKWSDYQRKMNKLHRWYVAGQGLNLEQYRSVDVRYDGQVVGVKEVDS